MRRRLPRLLRREPRRPVSEGARPRGVVFRVLSVVVLVLVVLPYFFMLLLLKASTTETDAAQFEHGGVREGGVTAAYACELGADASAGAHYSY